MITDTKSLHAYVVEHQPNICGIIGMKDGKIRYEDYFNGFDSSGAMHVMSVTKSVVSLLIGIAIDHGMISGVDCPVLNFFPSYTVKRGEKTIQSVTIQHLLTMTAPYKYRSEPWTRICTSDDWTRATLDILGGRSGITGEFKYSTLGIQILTGIISQASGMKTVDFANKYLFEPIGASVHKNYLAMTAEEHREFILSRKPHENLWFADPLGIGAGGYGLCLNVPDMARIGQLCLNGGICHGQRVVSRKWIAESTSMRSRTGEAFGDMGYGYMWWTPDVTETAYAALGNGGNVIYINPEKNTVVAVGCTFKPNIYDRVGFIKQYIEPLLDD